MSHRHLVHRSETTRVRIVPLPGEKAAGGLADVQIVDFEWCSCSAGRWRTDEQGRWTPWDRSLALRVEHVG